MYYCIILIIYLIKTQLPLYSSNISSLNMTFLNEQDESIWGVENQVITIRKIRKKQQSTQLEHS